MMKQQKTQSEKTAALVRIASHDLLRQFGGDFSRAIDEARAIIRTADLPRSGVLFYRRVVASLETNQLNTRAGYTEIATAMIGGAK